MSTPKRLVLDAASDGPFPLSKAELVSRLDETVIDQDVLLSVTLLEDDEFGTLDELREAIDTAFGMPDAITTESALEHDPPRAPRQGRSSVIGNTSGDEIWEGGARDLTVAELRSLLEDFEDDSVVTIELDDAEVSQPMAPIGVRFDEATGGIVIEATWLNSA
jgi:hypothetical protein